MVQLSWYYTKTYNYDDCVKEDHGLSIISNSTNGGTKAVCHTETSVCGPDRLGM